MLGSGPLVFTGTRKIFFFFLVVVVASYHKGGIIFSTSLMSQTHPEKHIGFNYFIYFLY